VPSSFTGEVLLFLFLLLLLLLLLMMMMTMDFLVAGLILKLGIFYRFYS